MSVTETLLSKIIDANDVPALDRFAITADMFQTQTEREAHDFIRKYSAENRGQSPSYATLVSNVPDFTYIPAVTDSYEYLARKLKETYGKRAVADYFESGEINARFQDVGKTLTLDDFVGVLTAKLEEIRVRASVRNVIGIDVKAGAAKFLAEYQARAAGLSSRIWASKFPSVNEALGGGYYSSNMYVVYARSGRGKSILTMEEAIEFAFQGAFVLVWALEMGWFEWMARFFSSVSARDGMTTATVDGIDYTAGFNNRDLQAARLDAEYEAAFTQFITEVNEIVPGRIILRSTDEEGFTERNLAGLCADIIETKADVVIVDPFYYLDYEANTSKTAGGDAAATSRKLRIMTGALGVLTLAITQADEDASEKNEDGVRELKPPKRSEVKKTKALLEDAAALIGIDTLAHEGRGVIEIGKGRSGGEDTRIEIVYLPNWGIVREPDHTDQAAQFSGTF
ncbi:DNA helicase [Paenibacillus sp. BIHB 4019]|uniref:DNA helicase n=1 Tax=Paenibacillus sp. BIHB 4019 TaxID=1870819 RepID=A0A1B2DIZ5_9BACL|nr:DnaB-like helicase C-terminal domain-containing protein [Paenibacillus sp. BIHB 4019]ANY67688.1 DNA helicase [Paenibacillus sp. BIHB 4019]